MKSSKADFQNLAILNSEFFTNSTLKKFNSKLPHLKELSLLNCPKITTELLTILPSFTFLEKIKLEGLPLLDFTSSFFFSEKSIVLTLPKLKTVFLKNCQGISELNLHCQALESLQIQDCLKVLFILFLFYLNNNNDNDNNNNNNNKRFQKLTLINVHL